MAVTQMPNGEYVNLPDDITPEGLKRVQAQYPSTRAQRVASGQPRKTTESAVAKQARTIDAARPGDDFTSSMMKGLLFSFGDEIAGGVDAATKGVYRAVRDGDISQIGKTYRERRDVEREVDRIRADRSPIASGAGEVAGAMLMPVGSGAGGVRALATGAEKLGMTRVAARLARGGEALKNARPLAQAVTAGGAQGALNAAGNADTLSNTPEVLLEGGGLGALTGGVVGGLANGITRGVQTLGDASAKNASRTAYSRIAELLDKGGTTAKKVEREIAVTDARGGDAMVQDMLPSLRAQAGAISRKPSVPNSNQLIERGEERIADRRARFGDQIRRDAEVPAAGDDALARADSLAATRKTTGEAGYETSGLMDTPIPASPELESYLNEAPEPVQKAFRNAYQSLGMRDQNVSNYVGENGIFTHIPNLRTFDAVKRSFDDQIGEALRAGRKSEAGDLSFQLDKLKGVLADANPKNAEYQAVLKSQRDLYQQQNALELGRNTLSRVAREPRLVLRDLQALPDHASDDARIGIIDALINSDNKADPVAFYRSITRNPNQRKVMEFAFGGKGNLGRFERWINREVRGTRADVLTAPGRQSETARFGLAESDAQENTGNVLSNALRGYAFGGGFGALSGVTRTLGNIAHGTGKLAQDEIAKILLSKGDKLVAGTEQAAAYQAKRLAGNTRRARALAKGGQQLYTDELGGN